VNPARGTPSSRGTLGHLTVLQGVPRVLEHLRVPATPILRAFAIAGRVARNAASVGAALSANEP